MQGRAHPRLEAEAALADGQGVTLHPVADEQGGEQGVPGGALGDQGAQVGGEAQDRAHQGAALARGQVAQGHGGRAAAEALHGGGLGGAGAQGVLLGAEHEQGRPQARGRQGALGEAQGVLAPGHVIEGEHQDPLPGELPQAAQGAHDPLLQVEPGGGRALGEQALGGA